MPEMSNAVMRMSALGGAMILEARGMETVMQICCRDRNRLALQGDILAAGGCGIMNIMANIRNQNSWIHSKMPEAATEKGCGKQPGCYPKAL